MPKTQLINYLPAALKHTAHGWTIEYSIVNPALNLMERRVVKMNRIRKRYNKVADFKAYCAEVIMRLNGQLASGWNPFDPTPSNSRELTPIGQALDIYIKEKEKEVRPDTIINYRSFTKVFGDWVAKQYGTIPVSSFTKPMAVAFMDYLAAEKDLHGRSWNNRMKQARAFFSWAIEKFYAHENPFASIKKKREEKKKRIMVPPDARRLVYEYFEKHNPTYITLMELVFTALIRPKEAWRLQVKDLHLDERYIDVSEDVSKTHYHRSPSLTTELIGRLKAMTANASPVMYLFGTDYKPGKKQMAYSRFRKDWDAMRLALKLPKEMQLYSLRDTGINEMLKVGIDPLSVMQHADHHDLSMTTRSATTIFQNAGALVLMVSTSFGSTWLA